MGFREYGSYGAVGLADLVRRKEVRAKELLDEAIGRTEKVNPRTNAVVVTGVPFLLKDVELLEGTRTTFGASIYRDDVADHKSRLAAQLEQASPGKDNVPPISG
jgi:amidase/6-aminohexanoate-cyclic-dimer hydrolase